jgi:hypothetical protein
MAMGEIGVCWEGMGVRGCFATPRLHGVYREIIKWAESFHIPGNFLDAISSSSPRRSRQLLAHLHAPLILIHDFQPFGDPEQFTAGFMCRRHAGVLTSLPLSYSYPCTKRKKPLPTSEQGFCERNPTIVYPLHQNGHLLELVVVFASAVAEVGAAPRFSLLSPETVTSNFLYRSMKAARVAASNRVVTFSIAFSRSP